MYGNLCVTRKIGEKIMIDGGEIELLVSKIKGQQVTIAISAPLDVDVDREEVFNAKQENHNNQIRHKNGSALGRWLGYVR